jgi:hypothetical protein
MKWLDDSVATGVFPVKLSPSSGNFTTAKGGVLNAGEIEFEIIWKRAFGVMNIRFNDTASTSATWLIGGNLSAPNSTLQIAPISGNWPDDFVRTDQQNRTPVTIRIDNDITNGMIVLPSMNSPSAGAFILERDLITAPTQFGNVNNLDNGIHVQNISVMVDS